MSGPDRQRRIVVLGGGITGLSAAWEASAVDGVQVTVVEEETRFGGKVRTGIVTLPTGHITIDEGADNFLARVPDAVELCIELGLEDQLTQPALGRAAVWVGGEVRPYPPRHVLGVPLDVDELAATGIVSPEALEVVAAESALPDDAAGPDGDVSIGDYLSERLGREVADHVVGPLVGGINAGDIDELSLRAVTPQLADAATRGGSLTRTLQGRLAAAPPPGPVFRALLGGTSSMVYALMIQLMERGVELRAGSAATAVLPAAGSDDEFDDSDGDRHGGYVVRLADGTSVDADAVVVTLPAPAAATVLADVSPAAAAELRSIHHVPVAFVTFAFRHDQVEVPADLSGILIPRDAGLLATAVSFGSNKWPHWDDGTHAILRVAAGHRHDDRPSTMSDDELVDALRADLATVLGITAEPVVARVTRWSPGFAQYAVGHLELVERVHAALAADAPGVLVAGGDLGGLGIPACIAQGRTAARALLA